ncbi:MAG: alpha/beta hydrolase [Polaromonas sp.]|nr:alpha/beta hydrolase [Polaromonas sp.]
MNKSFKSVTALIVLAAAVALPHSSTTAQDLNASIHEAVVMVPKKSGLFAIELETTIYKPDGLGPFPVVVINHGKAPGDSKFQSRYRVGGTARYFMQRGYVVVAPMRQGFSKSSGSYIGGGCNVQSNGIAQADDVKAVLDYITAQPYADKNQLLVMGQSHGGWTTLAFGTLNYPGVKGLVNFAGGLRQESCPGWESGLARAAGNYGAATQLPSLWFYGDNDSYFSTDTYSDMFQRYNAAGGKARLVAFGVYGADAHAMFGPTGGQYIWQPEVTRFLAQVGLPSQPLPEFARYRPAAVAPTRSLLEKTPDAPAN